MNRHPLIAADRPEARALDPGYLCDHLPAFPALKGRVERLDAVSSWIKPGRYFNVAFEARDSQGELAGRVAVGVLNDELRRKIANYTDQPCTEGPDCARCAFSLIGEGLFAQVFPFDLRLKALPSVARRPSRLRLEGNRVRSLHLQAWRPGMRCSFRAKLGNGTRAYVKVSALRDLESAFDRARRVYDAVEAAGSLRVPRPIACDAKAQTMIYAACPGVKLGDGEAAEAARLAARALVAFQALDPVGIARVHTPADELLLIATWTEYLERLEHEAADEISARLDELRRAMPSTSAVPSLVHRDFYDGQLLADGDRVVVLDLDTSCRGDRELDVGNYLAHRALRAFEHGDTAFEAGLAGPFYEAVADGIDGAAARWYLGSSLLRLASMYALRPDGAEVWQPCLREAARL